MIEILLVDDEAALLDVTKIFMEKNGSMKITAVLPAKEARIPSSHTSSTRLWALPGTDPDYLRD